MDTCLCFPPTQWHLNEARMHYEGSTCIVSESTKGDGRIHTTDVENFTFSLPGFSSHDVATQDGDNEAAAKSYSEPIYASVNTERSACSYDLRGELSLLLIIHETSYITI